MYSMNKQRVARTILILCILVVGMVTQSVSVPASRRDLSVPPVTGWHLDSEPLSITGGLLSGNYVYTHAATGYRFPASFPDYVFHEVIYTDDEGSEVIVAYNAQNGSASLTFSIYPAPIYALGPEMLFDAMGFPQPRDVLNDSHPEILSTDAFKEHYEQVVYSVLYSSSEMELVDAGNLHVALPEQNGPTGVQAILYDHADVPTQHEILLFESLGYYILIRLNSSDTNDDVTWNHEFPSIDIPDIYGANLDQITSVANQGNPDALYTRAYIEHVGWGKPIDWQAALNWLKRAAEAGHLQAIMQLVEEYRATDHEKVRYWLNRAIEVGTPEALYESTVFLLWNAINDEPRAGAAEFLEVMAEDGYIPAMHELAFIYYYGVIVERNVDDARTWLETAVALGDGVAAEILEDMDEGFPPRSSRMKPQDQ